MHGDQKRQGLVQQILLRRMASQMGMLADWQQRERSEGLSYCACLQVQGTDQNMHHSCLVEATAGNPHSHYSCCTWQASQLKLYILADFHHQSGR